MRQFVKDSIKKLLYRPHGLRMGVGSQVRRPWTLYNLEYIEIGAATRIGGHTILNPIRHYEGTPHGGHIVIGDHVYVGGHCQIHAMQRLEIRAGAVLSDHVYINDASHGMDPRQGLIMKQPIHSKGPVVIGEHAFIGFGSVVLPAVTLGRHCIVAARSVVTRSFPDFSMVAGNPARLIKRFHLESGKWLDASEALPAGSVE